MARVGKVCMPGLAGMAVSTGVMIELVEGFVLDGLTVPGGNESSKQNIASAAVGAVDEAFPEL
jgi:hypothetical protein